MKEDNEEFVVPFKIKNLPFRKCELCNKRTLTTSYYEVHDAGLNSYINVKICNKCYKI